MFKHILNCCHHFATLANDNLSSWPLAKNQNHLVTSTSNKILTTYAILYMRCVATLRTKNTWQKNPWSPCQIWHQLAQCAFNTLNLIWCMNSPWLQRCMLSEHFIQQHQFPFHIHSTCFKKMSMKHVEWKPPFLCTNSIPLFYPIILTCIFVGTKKTLQPMYWLKTLLLMLSMLILMWIED